VADRANNRLRRISNGVINTVAGNGTVGFSGDDAAAVNAQLSLPSGVAVDLAGNLYIADYGNRRVREVSNGIIYTAAGGGAGFVFSGPATGVGLSGPLGIAVDSLGDVFFTDNAQMLR
jgi:NHL repeat